MTERYMFQTWEETRCGSSSEKARSGSRSKVISRRRPDRAQDTLRYQQMVSWLVYLTAKDYAIRDALC